MTEQEYIHATNLAKVRAAKTIVRDVLAMTAAEMRWQSHALKSLTRIEDWHSSKVRTTEKKP